MVLNHASLSGIVSGSSICGSTACARDAVRFLSADEALPQPIQQSGVEYLPIPRQRRAPRLSFAPPSFGRTHGEAKQTGVPGHDSSVKFSAFPIATHSIG